jgi:predicted PurR-regulated permease PerM
MKEQDIVLHLSNKTIIKIALFAGLFFSLYYMRDLIIIILMSVVIASSVDPAAKRLKKYKIPRGVSVFGIFTLVIGLFLTIIYLFIPIVVHEFSGFVQAIPQILQSVTNFFGTDTQSAETLRTIIGDPSQFTAQDIFATTKGALSGIGNGVLGATGAFFQTITTIILIIVISFYLSVQENGIETFLKILSPKKSEAYVIDLWKRSQAKIAKWMQGQLILGLIIGVMVYIGLAVMGVPYALLLALLAGMFELIPIFGPILSMVPAVLLAFTSGGITLAGSVVIFYIIVQRLENDLIYPMVVNKVTGVNPLVVILALLVGAKLAGIWGILLSVPVVSALMEFVNDVQREKEIG